MPRKPLQIGTWGRISRTQAAPAKWVARARFRDDDGVTRKVEAWGKSGAAAERALIIAMTDRATSSGADITAHTRLSYLADYWLRTEVDTSTRSSNTKERYRYVVEATIVPSMGGLTVRELTVAAADRHLKRIADDKGPATAKLAKSVLSGIMTLAVRNEAAATNPLRDVTPIATASKEVRALSLDEVTALRATLARDTKAVRADLPALVDMMLATGARVGEVAAFCWGPDIDLEEGTVALTGTVVRVKGQGLTRQDTTKGRKVTRLRLPAFAVTLLMQRRVLGRDGGPANLVFPSQSGGLREVTTIDRQWRDFRERHPEWKWVTPHAFRKTVATLLEAEAGLAAAAEQLTHARPEITRKHYVQRPDVAPDMTAVLELFAGESAG